MPPRGDADQTGAPRKMTNLDQHDGGDGGNDETDRVNGARERLRGAGAGFVTRSPALADGPPH